MRDAAWEIFGHAYESEAALAAAADAGTPAIVCGFNSSISSLGAGPPGSRS